MVRIILQRHRCVRSSLVHSSRALHSVAGRFPLRSWVPVNFAVQGPVWVRDMSEERVHTRKVSRAVLFLLNDGALHFSSRHKVANGQ